MKKDIPEFLAHALIITVVHSIEKLGGFFNEERLQRRMSLFFIPRASFGRTETRNNIKQKFQVFN
jgi:hypothetical protein